MRIVAICVFGICLLFSVAHWSKPQRLWLSPDEIGVIGDIRETRKTGSVYVIVIGGDGLKIGRGWDCPDEKIEGLKR